MIVRGQKSSLIASGSPGTATWATNPVAGQKVIFVVWAQDAETISSVVDNGTVATTYTLDGSISTGTVQVLVYRADNIKLPASGNYAVTLTGTGGHSVNGAGIAYSGVRPGPPTRTTTNTGTSTSVSTGSVTPAGSGALLVAGYVDAFASNPETITFTGSPFTQEFVQTNGSSDRTGAFADLIAAGGPSAESCSWTLGTSVQWNGIIAAYDALAPGLLAATIV